MSTGHPLKQERGERCVGIDLFRAAMDASPHGMALREGETLLYTNPAWHRLMKSEGTEARSHISGTADEAQREIVTSSHVFDHDGAELSLIVAQDVTEQRKTERRLQEAQKLESLGRWVGGVVHDFNNLLTAVMLYSDMIAQSAEGGTAIARYNDEIRELAKRGAGLTGQLLTFVQQRPFERAVVSVNTLLKGLRDVLERMTGEDVAVCYELASETCQVKIAPVQLQQVVINLALNARDAMTKGGSLTFKTREVDADIGNGIQSCVRLEVADNGSGMDASTRERIFEPFFTTKAEGKGTGLGLTIVRQILVEAGGSIVVESEAGAGSVISVILPRAEPAMTREVVTAAESQLETASETVLLVEGDAAVRSSLVEALVAQRYQVLEASNGDEALQLSRDFAYDIHLLITDLVLPGISGREVARRVRSERAGARVLFVSGYGVDSCCGNDIIFAKPFNREALVLRIREALSETSVSADEAGGR